VLFRSYDGSESYNECGELAEKYSPGSAPVCYVNPSDPGKAFLTHEKPWMIFVVIVPLIFVLIGGGLIWGLWFYKEKKTVAKSEPLSQKTVPLTHRAGVIFFGIFFVAGCLVFYFLFFKPLIRIIEAGNWNKISATVISGTIREHDGEDGSSYSADILYSYEFDGKEYKSNHYSFMDFSGSYKGAKKTLADYPPGKKFLCYVNPKNPGDSVIRRDIPATIYFAFIPLAFILVGLAGMTGCFWKKTDPLKYTPGMYERDVVLKSATSPGGRFIRSLIFSIIWNGITYFMVSYVISSYREGHREICLTAFSIFLVLVGIITTIGTIAYFLALFNPRPILILSSNPLPLGGISDIKWEISGNCGAVRKLSIYLEGREEAIYTHGSSTSTDREKFLTLNILETNDLRRIISGRADFDIPKNTMHSFKSEHNKIIWTIYVIGEIKCWPDIREEFEVTVLPEEVI